MGYYLSKANRAIMESIIPLLKPDKDIVLNTSDPVKLEYIVRGAYKRPEFKWISDKFIIQVTSSQVLFKLKQLHIEEAYEILPNLTFFDIINHLIMRQPDAVVFSSPEVTQDEVEGLKNWAEANKYKIDVNHSEFSNFIEAIKVSKQ